MHERKFKIGTCSSTILNVHEKNMRMDSIEQSTQSVKTNHQPKQSTKPDSILSAGIEVKEFFIDNKYTLEKYISDY